MKRLLLFAAAASLVALAGCSTIQNLASTNVPVNSIIVAANGVDAATTVATSYVKYCTPAVQPAGCSDEAIQKLIPAVRSLRDARNSAEAFLAANPDAKFGPATLVSAVTNATTALQAIETEYGVTGKN
ncbi:MAG: hypothetical protein EPN45_17980 [Rhizobiaceae bacterium]|nr:MAG: hypothetical protein EPN45_17980 [Rhizobiaceae bacterium]